MQVQSYLMFEGRCEEALEFYKRALGAEVLALKRYSENPDGCAEGQPMPPADKVMHAALRIGETVVFASDGMCSGKPNFQGFSLSVTAGSDAEAARLFDAIGAGGGKVQMPITRTFFASSFGMVEDRFGVSWMFLAGLANA
jgi:PhnB protein